MARKETIDFSGVSKEIGAREAKLPPGDYKFKIIGVEKKWKDNDKSNAAYYRWEMSVAEGDHKGTKKSYTTSLKPEALWNLRNLIHAATGKNVAGKSLAFNPDGLVGKFLMGTVEDEEWVKNGESRMSSKVVDVQPVSEGTDDDEDEEETEEEEDEDLEDVDLDEI